MPPQPFPVGAAVLIRLSDSRDELRKAVVIEPPRYESGRLRNPSFNPETHVNVRTDEYTTYCLRHADVTLA